MTFAQAAQHAIQLGGIYDGHEAPADVNKLTKASVAALAGQGLVAAAKDNYPRDGTTFSYVASFAEVEVDVETGKYYIVDFLAYADVGTVIHPAGARRPGARPLDARHRPCDRAEVGVRSALRRRWFRSASTRTNRRRFWTSRSTCNGRRWTFPIRRRPWARAAFGEPPVGGGCAAILNALSDALGDEIFRRAPVNADTILTSLEAGRPMQHPLMAHI